MTRIRSLLPSASALLLLLIGACPAVAAEDLWPTRWSPFGALENGCNGTINAIARLPGGDYVVGGLFSNCSGTVVSNIARYSPTSDQWSSLGDGVDSHVLALAVLGDQLYAGGVFEHAGAVPASSVARWDGETWNSLGAGVPTGTGLVYALAVSGTDLYVGGQFATVGTGIEARNIARWDGLAWSSVGSGLANGTDGTVHALAATVGRLCAGGRFNQAGGLAARQVACWDGQAWSALGNGIAGTVYSLAFAGQSLYAGGDLNVFSSEDPRGIARWDGQSWSSVGSGVNGSVLTIATATDGTLYAAGYFSEAGGVSAAGVARWDGSSWSALDGIAGALQVMVKTLAVDGDSVLAGGRFDEAGGTPANSIARWDGANWQRLGQHIGQGLNGIAAALLEDGNGQLLVGGSFSQAGSVPARRIARWSDQGWSSLAGGPLDGWSTPWPGPAANCTQPARCAVPAGSW